MPRRKTPETSVTLFESKAIRRIWHEEQWFYSVVDVIEVLTQSLAPAQYWRDMKRRMSSIEEWNETQANCLTFKLEAADGKLRETDCADNRTLLRIMQSIPSPRAEPFKQWLAEVGAERIEEIDDPERLTARQRKLYLAKGFPVDWVETRVKGIEVHEDLTEERKARGVTKSIEHAILTNEIAEATFGLDVQDHQDVKGLSKRDNLRDHMSRMELILTMLGEATAHDLHDTRDSYGFDELQRDSNDAGNVAGRARLDIEQQIGRPVVTPDNFLHLTRPPSSTSRRVSDPHDEPADAIQGRLVEAKDEDTDTE